MDRAEQQLRRRRARDRSLALLLLGLALLLPPMAYLFQLQWTLLGAPATLIYLFVVWAGLIVGAAWLSRQLQDDDAP